MKAVVLYLQGLYRFSTQSSEGILHVNKAIKKLSTGHHLTCFFIYDSIEVLWKKKTVCYVEISYQDLTAIDLETTLVTTARDATSTHLKKQKDFTIH